MTRNTPHPAHARLTDKLTAIGLQDDRARDFAAWLNGLKAAQLPDLTRLTPAEADFAVKRIEDHWFSGALIDEWEVARAKEAADAKTAAEEGAEWLR